MAKNELVTPLGDSAMDETNDALKTTLATTLAGEDVSNDVLKVEQRFTYVQVTADTAVKSAPGFLHTVTFACADATPTAGTITIYDNTAASLIPSSSLSLRESPATRTATSSMW